MSLSFDVYNPNNRKFTQPSFFYAGS